MERENQIDRPPVVRDDAELRRKLREASGMEEAVFILAEDDARRRMAQSRVEVFPAEGPVKRRNNP